MKLKCLDHFTSSLILASLTLVACIVRSEFLISVLNDTTQPNRLVDKNINNILIANVVFYVILGLSSVLLIFAIVKKRHTLMLPWLSAAIISVLCELIFVFYILTHGHRAHVLYLLIGTALAVWVIWVMFSAFKSIRYENRFIFRSNMSDSFYCTAKELELF